MENLKILTHNAYGTSDNGTPFRVVAIAGKWRICRQGRTPGNWDFVNATEYPSMTAALQDVDLY